MKDILITGMGVLSTAGYTLPRFWDTLCAGINAYGALSGLSGDQYRTKIGAQIASESWRENLPAGYEDAYAKAALYSVSTALRALEDAGIAPESIHGKRTSVVIGTTMGEIEAEEEITRRICWQEKVERDLYRKYPAQNIAAAVAQAVGATGRCYTISAACAAGNYATCIAKNLLQWDVADVVIVGGVDVFSYVAFAGFQRLISLTPDFCRPFALNRKGLVLGEGCGVIILEREGERVQNSKHGRILGTGIASNAYHMTAPHYNGDGERRAMEQAIQDAGIGLSDVGHISAHGTGTKLNDKIEAKAIVDLFGKAAPDVSSIKSMLGHSMGAASMLELIASALMIEKNTILPTMNVEQLDTECPVDIVKDHPVQRPLRYVLSNSFAFGGQTSSIVVGE